MVVANPPYIATGEISGLDPDVRDFEPLLALEAGTDGLDVYRRLLPEAARVLLPGGTVLLEVGAGQAAAVADLATQAGFAAIDIHRDLSGKDRMVEAARPGCRVLPLDEVDDMSACCLATALRAGAVIGVPTDTVYGFAAAWNSREGIRRLFAAKGRGESRPVGAIFSSVQSILDCLPDLDPSAVHVLQTLLPGPYTFVVETNVPRPNLVGTPDSLGVRVPDHPALLAFLDKLATPIAATSANLSGQPDAAAVEEVDSGLLSHCSAALASPAGFTLGGAASTVVDLRPLAEGKEVIILREGAVTAAEVFARLGAG
jgi:tRNA threonylcarbamoyl adenosine modification protein (Sua5/YciO/YrdC/YwlC family)